MKNGQWLHTSELRFVLTSKIFVESKKQKKKKELSRKSISNSEERVLKMIAAIIEYENPFAVSSTRKSKLKNIVTGSGVGSERLNDIQVARAIGKEYLGHLINQRFFEENISFWDSVKKLNLKTFSNGGNLLYFRKKPKQSLSKQT